MTPLSTPPAQCSTNWLTRLACKTQALIDPLCEKSVNFKLSGYEQGVIALDLRQTNALTGWQTQQNNTAQKWLQIIEANGLAMSEGTAKILAPRFTVPNRIGLSVWKAFSVGTTCSCCHGWRVVFLAIIAGAVGYVFG